MGNPIDAVNKVYNNVNDFVVGLSTGDKNVKKVKFPPIFSGYGSVQNVNTSFKAGTIWDGYGTTGSHSTASTNI